MAYKLHEYNVLSNIIAGTDNPPLLSHLTRPWAQGVNLGESVSKALAMQM